jgi:hypothetical protein
MTDEKHSSLFSENSLERFAGMLTSPIPVNYRLTLYGKVFFGSSTNLHGPLNRDKFMISTGMHKNEQVQKDWTVPAPFCSKFLKLSN